MKKIRVEVGHIVQVSQLLESGLKYASALSMGLDGEDYSEEKFITELETCNKRTLGPLISRFKKHIPVNIEFEDILSQALGDRNFVIHNVFDACSDNLNSSKGRQDLIKKLEESRSNINQGVIVVHQMILVLMEASKLDPETISKAIRNEI